MHLFAKPLLLSLAKCSGWKKMGLKVCTFHLIIDILKQFGNATKTLPSPYKRDTFLIALILTSLLICV